METIDYAEMLEIPVSTVNVVRKGRRRKFRREEALKERAIDAVNEMQTQAEGQPEAEAPLPAEKKRRGRMEIALIAEFAAACLLCTFIFLTNIFYENSAMNRYASGLFSTENEADTRVYSDFTLSGVVSELADDVEIAVSSAGVMSFTGKASVYPVCDGTIERVAASADGSTVEIRHSDSFKSVITGLRDVYLSEGDEALANIPMGYADGTVRVMLYADGTLLNCFTLDEENALRWS